MREGSAIDALLEEKESVLAPTGSGIEGESVSTSEDAEPVSFSGREGSAIDALLSKPAEIETENITAYTPLEEKLKLLNSILPTINPYEALQKMQFKPKNLYYREKRKAAPKGESFADLNLEKVVEKEKAGEQLTKKEQEYLQYTSGEAPPSTFDDPVNLTAMAMIPGYAGKTLLARAATGAALNLGYETGYRLLDEKRLPHMNEAITASLAGAIMGPALSWLVRLKPSGSEKFANEGIETLAKALGKSVKQVQREIAEDIVKTGLNAETLISNKIRNEVQNGPRVANEIMMGLIKSGEASTDPSAMARAYREILDALPKGPRMFAEHMKKADSAIYEEVVREPIVSALVKTATKNMPVGGASEQRVFRDVADIIEDMLFNNSEQLDYIKPLLDDLGIDYATFAREYMETVSKSGRILNYHSQVPKKLGRVFNNTPAGEIFDEMAKKSSAKLPGYEWFDYWFENLDNIRRASLVSQLSTAMRNLETQVGRGGIEIFDTFLQGFVQGKPAQGAREAWTEALVLVGKMSKEQGDVLLRTLDDFPYLEHRLYAAPVHEVAAINKYTKTLNWFNQRQEMFSRRHAYKMRLARNLKQHGIDPFTASMSEAMEKVGEKEWGKMVRDAVDFGLDMSFANSPKTGFGKNMMTIWNMPYLKPFLRVLNPFPRFQFGNALNFMFDFSPFGFIKMFSDDAFKTVADQTKLTKKGAETLSRGLMGLIFTGLGAAVRDSDFAGPKPWEISVGDSVIDTRIFAPIISPYLVLGEMVNMANPLASEKTKLRARANMTDPKTFSQSVLMPLVGLNRVAGTTLVFADWLRGRASFTQEVKSIPGQYIGGYSVPLRQIKDFMAAFPEYQEEAYYRDIRNRPIAGPFLANIPVVSRDLPYLYSPFKDEPSKAEHPMLRQLTGINLRKMSHLEKTARGLNLDYRQIYPVTGVPEADNLMRKYMGLWITRQPDFTTSAKFQALDRNLQRIAVRGFMTEAKAFGRLIFNMTFPEHPDLNLQTKIKNIDRDKREYMGLGDIKTWDELYEVMQERNKPPGTIQQIWTGQKPKSKGRPGSKIDELLAQ